MFLNLPCDSSSSRFLNMEELLDSVYIFLPSLIAHLPGHLITAVNTNFILVINKYIFQKRGIPDLYIQLSVQQMNLKPNKYLKLGVQNQTLISPLHPITLTHLLSPSKRNYHFSRYWSQNSWEIISSLSLSHTLHSQSISRSCQLFFQNTSRLWHLLSTSPLTTLVVKAVISCLYYCHIF